MTSLNVALIGVGVMGRHHARVLQELEGVELRAVIDPRYAGGELQGLPVHGELTEKLASSVDYCVIAAPTNQHESLALAAVSFGLPALIEKPLGPSIPSAATIERAFREAKLVAGVGHIERYNSAVLEAEKVLQRGELGRVVQIMTSRQGPYPARVSDVGVTADLASHDFNLTACLAGSRYRQIVASEVRLSDSKHEDSILVQGQMENGVLTSHIVNWISPTKERRVVILATEGSMTVDMLTADLTICRNGTGAPNWPQLEVFKGVQPGDVNRPYFPKVEPLRAEHTAFRDALLGLVPDLTVSLVEGCETVSVIDACLRSTVSHSWEKPVYTHCQV